jgi:dTDP-4-amino-4,6-dideoxygalactose transaminase
VPVFADVDPATLNIDPSGIEGLLSPRTKAIVVTHLYGKLADVDSVLRIARAAGVAVIEDCAHAHGASRDGRLAGSLADVAAFSFYPTKNLGGLGDGGAVVTNDGAIAEKVRCLHQYGWSERYCAAMPQGRNSRLDAVQAAVLRVKLPQLDVRNERCRDIVAAYREAARGTGLQVLHEPGTDFVAHLCVALHEDRDALRARLADCGVETAIHYPVPDHRQPALACVPWRVKSLEVTDQASRNIFSLPCFSELTDSEVEYICRQISQHA